MIKLHSRDYKKVTLGLGLGSFLVFCNLYYFQPLLPYFMVKFNVSALQVNWLFSSTILAIALSLIPCINLLMFLSQELQTLIILRAVLGVALAGFIAVAVVAAIYTVMASLALTLRFISQTKRQIESDELVLCT